MFGTHKYLQCRFITSIYKHVIPLVLTYAKHNYMIKKSVSTQMIVKKK